jgi:Mce-associated membrane protein
MTRILVAIVVLALGCTAWFGIETTSLSPGDNQALVDTAATSDVSAQVSDAVKAVFSYDYANLPRTERAASEVLTGDAVRQYQTQFASARTRATSEKLIRTTTVRAIGVRSLRGDSADLLLFLDQQTVAQGGGAPTSSVAQLAVTANRVDGRWKLATLTPL